MRAAFFTFWLTRTSYACPPPPSPPLPTHTHSVLRSSRRFNLQGQEEGVDFRRFGRPKSASWCCLLVTQTTQTMHVHQDSAHQQRNRLCAGCQGRLAACRVVSLRGDYLLLLRSPSRRQRMLRTTPARPRARPVDDDVLSCPWLDRAADVMHNFCGRCKLSYHTSVCLCARKPYLV